MMHEFRSAEEQRRNTKQRGQGHQGGGEPGAKTNQPPCDLLPGTQEYLIYYRGLPCERTHHGKGLSQVTSFFSFSFFVPSTHADSTTTLTCFTLPRLFKAARFASLRSTNNYRNSSNNYQLREIPRGGAEEEVPAGRPCPGNSTAPSSPPRSNPVTPQPA